MTFELAALLGMGAVLLFGLIALLLARTSLRSSGNPVLCFAFKGAISEDAASC